MGRKALIKTRKENPHKKLLWAKQIFTYCNKKGLKTVTADDFAAVLGKSKATVYKYFKSKDEVINLIVDYKINELRAIEKTENDQAATFLDKYRSLSISIMKHYSGMSSLFINDLLELYPVFWKSLDRTRDKTLAVLKNIYEQGMAEGILLNYNSDLLITIDKLFFTTLSNASNFSSKGFTLKTAQEDYLTLRCNGIMDIDVPKQKGVQKQEKDKKTKKSESDSQRPQQLQMF